MDKHIDWFLYIKCSAFIQSTCLCRAFCFQSGKFTGSFLYIINVFPGTSLETQYSSVSSRHDHVLSISRFEGWGDLRRTLVRPHVNISKCQRSLLWWWCGEMYFRFLKPPSPFPLSWGSLFFRNPTLPWE